MDAGKHIPDVMATGCFEQFQFVRLLETDETEGPTYATQYYAASKADYNRYITNHAPALRKDGIDTWGDNFVGFRSFNASCELIVDSFESLHSTIENFPIFLSNACPACISANMP